MVTNAPNFDLDAYEREIAEVQALVERGGTPLRATQVDALYQVFGWPTN